MDNLYSFWGHKVSYGIYKNESTESGVVSGHKSGNGNNYYNRERNYIE